MGRTRSIAVGIAVAAVLFLFSVQVAMGLARTGYGPGALKTALSGAKAIQLVLVQQVPHLVLPQEAL